MEMHPIQVTQQGILIPAEYLPEGDEYELVRQERYVVVRPKEQRTSYPVNDARDTMLREIEAFKAMHADLVRSYLGEYVAIYQGHVVDHDGDPVALLQRIREHYPGRVVLRRKVEEQAETTLHVRSPRLVSRP